jgi:hypothetical protein
MAHLGIGEGINDIAGKKRLLGTTPRVSNLLAHINVHYAAVEPCWKKKGCGLAGAANALHRAITVTGLQAGASRLNMASYMLL